MPSRCPHWLDEHACLFPKRTACILCPFLPSYFSTMPVASFVLCFQGRALQLSLGWTLLPGSSSQTPLGLSPQPPLLFLLPVWQAAGRPQAGSKCLSSIQLLRTVVSLWRIQCAQLPAHLHFCRHVEPSSGSLTCKNWSLRRGLFRLFTKTHFMKELLAVQYIFFKIMLYFLTSLEDVVIRP